MRRKIGKNGKLLFLIGTFSMTQVHLGANIGISEFFVFLCAPYVFLKDSQSLKHDGFMPMVWLVVLTGLSCLLSGYVNHIDFPRLFRGFSSVYSLFAWIVVLHRLLRPNLDNLKWLLFGIACSMTINVFAFQTGQSGDGAVNGVYGDAMEITMNNAVFWISRINQWGQLPIKGWYLQTPFAYSVLFPLFMVGFSMLTTESGRSSALNAILSVCFLVFGGRRMMSMRKLSHNFVMLAIVGIVILFAFKSAYQYGATNGLLGEKTQEKYEKQTKGKKDILSLIMGGRGEVFIGLFACLDRPWIGHGSWAYDTGQYVERFLIKYGEPEDYWKYLEETRILLSQGISGMTIPAHSHIVGFWLWYGLPGMILWVYVIYIMIQCVSKYLGAVPQWFGFLALSIPGMFWNIFFSGFGQRIGDSLFIAVLLFARAVGEGKVQLPPQMVMEALRHK